jgi:hypothetical protein
VADAPTNVGWAEYRSPLVGRIESIRTHIRAQAARHGWPVRDDQLDDRHIIRRIILKRCVYGVDLNPMAVELAKLSLWLHSFTVGAPLSFLDHHLRCGDSLFGEFVHGVEEDLRRRYGLAMSQAVVRARQGAAGMALIEDTTDADIAEVHTSMSAFAGVEDATADLRRFLDFYHAARWLPGTDIASSPPAALRRRLWRSDRNCGRGLGHASAPRGRGCHRQGPQAVHRLRQGPVGGGQGVPR